MTPFNVYLLCGVAYCFYLWQWATPPEEKKMEGLLDVTNMATQSIGAIALWPLIFYINHFWNGPDDSNE